LADLKSQSSGTSLCSLWSPATQSLIGYVDFKKGISDGRKKKYPQIPSTVWLGVRALLHRSPSVVVNESFLSAELAVQEVAAKAYINELKNVGLLNEDGKATALAAKWRLDDSYEEAVQELVRNNYDENLAHLSPMGSNLTGLMSLTAH
jgi:hypothetical protein